MSFEPVKVLLIEDLRAAQKVATEIFSSLGCKVLIASSASYAFGLMLNRHSDIVFIDLMLPDIDGFEIPSIIRSMERHNTRIPLIAVTANSSEDLGNKCRLSGFDDWLVKPVTLESVRYILYKHLDKHRRSA